MFKQREVEFPSKGEKIRGDLVLPDGDGPFPLLVMGGGWCYVKEIVMPHYAKAFVAKGVAVLMFDYRCMGASEGLPRQHIDPAWQIEDYKSAVTYGESLPEIDADRIGVWGISYAGGHVLAVGATDERVKCVISNIPVVDGYENMRRVHGSQRFQALNERILADRRERTRSGSSGGRMPMSSLKPFEELCTWPFPSIYTIFHDIKQREAPRHEHWSTIESTELLLSYDVKPYAQRLYDKPTLMVVAEGDEITLWDLEIAVFNSIPSARKKLAVLPKVSHMSLYAKQADLAFAGRLAADFAAEHLGAQ
ncbi:alpha/beta hydrolase [Cupriavidus taiwanensis]|uniref:alpha/beta hydrolase n=1 Tax=Cupriavidus taiwanensis TaxID=164546 RepID=UPI000E2FDBD1|nr:alpha/beta fold hydrolase [Cupriavidus taiwanensis]